MTVVSSVETFFRSYLQAEYEHTRARLTKADDYDAAHRRATEFWAKGLGVPYMPIYGSLKAKHQRRLDETVVRPLFKASTYADVTYFVVGSAEPLMDGEGYFLRLGVRGGDSPSIISEESACGACSAMGCSRCASVGFEHVRGEAFVGGTPDGVARYADPPDRWLPAHERDA